MKNFKPRKSVKRFICETLISALVLTVILGIIYYLLSGKTLGTCYGIDFYT